MNPKISVLIPMYNRKRWIGACVDSVLNQTFQDFEIIVRDNCSTDGSVEFLQENYGKQISTGKLKIFRNPENLGETGNISALIKDATGNYLTVLHSDDLFLPHALQHLYEVAEKTNADVVHQSLLLISPKSGIINDIKDCKPLCYEPNIINQVTMLPDDPLYRFKEWITGSTCYDIQYNLFSSKFIWINNINVTLGHSMFAALRWLMLAKVVVKTPVICYIRRDAPDSQSNKFDVSPEIIEKFICGHIDTMRKIDNQLLEMEFFKNNEPFRYMVNSRFWIVDDNFEFYRRQFYKNGITPDIYQAVSNAFKKYFGDDYFLPMFLFNWIHAVAFNKRPDIINFVNTPPDSTKMI